MRVKILPAAARDLMVGYRFYQEREDGVGQYFLDTLHAEIRSLTQNGGIHPRVLGRYHWMISRRFPFAVFYVVEKEVVTVHAVFDTRRDPERIKKLLK